MVGRWHSPSPNWQYITYIPLIVLAEPGGLYATYHLLWEPETTIAVTHSETNKSSNRSLKNAAWKDDACPFEMVPENRWLLLLNNAPFEGKSFKINTKICIKFESPVKRVI